MYRSPKVRQNARIEYQRAPHSHHPGRGADPLDGAALRLKTSGTRPRLCPGSHSEGGARSEADYPEVHAEREMAPSLARNLRFLAVGRDRGKKANNRHQNGFASLKMVIRRAISSARNGRHCSTMASISRDGTWRACARFRRRVEQVKAAEGGHIE